MQIYGNAKESFVTAQERAWGAALTLIALAFLFTVVRPTAFGTASEDEVEQ